MSEGALSAGGVILSVLPDTKAFGATLKSKLLGHTAGVGESMGGMLMGGLKSMAGPVAAVAGAMSIDHIVEGSIHSFENLAGSVNSMKRVVGGSVEAVSSLRAAFQLAGVDTDQATSSMAKLSKTLFSDAGGKKGTPAGDAMRLMGIQFKDAKGQILPMTDLMPKIAEQFSKMPDGANKTAMAMTLFGRSGTQMLPFLNKGAAGLSELEAKAKNMGLTLDEAGIEKFKESRKAQREFQATMQGLSVTLGEAFLPVLEGVQNAFRQYLIPLIEKATAYIKAHRKQFDDLGRTLEELVLPILDGLSKALEAVVNWVLNNQDVVKSLLVTIGTAMVVWKGYTLVMGAVKAAKMLMAAATVAETGATEGATVAQWLFNAALTANPIGIIIVAVAALVAGLIYFFTQTKLGQAVWKQFTAFLGDSMAILGKAFGAVWDGIVVAFKVSFDFISGLFKGYVNVWITLLDIIIGALDTIQVKIPNWVPGMGGQTWGVNIPKIPKLAEGGIVPATPGGRTVQVAEAGQAEAIIPLDKLAKMGAGKHTTINYYAAKNDSIDAKQKLVDAVQRAKLLGAI